jgi:glycerophosphoryl diester phosphodiesterase
MRSNPAASEASRGSGRLNPWLDRRVIAYAHQGGAWEAPSSTLLAIRGALDAGATGIELDVHATTDGALVVCHDPSVDRTTDGSGRICDLSLAEVQALDNAYWFVPGADVTPGLEAEMYPYRGRAPDDPDLRIATLAEVLALLDDHPGVVLNLDIKQTAPAVRPYEEQLARTLADHGWGDRVIVASFLDLATESFSLYAPEIATSAGAVAVAEFWQALNEGSLPPELPHAALQVPAVHEGIVVVDEKFVDAAHLSGLAVHVWTIDDRAEMEKLVALGVDGIITDLPTTLVEVLEEEGAGWDPRVSA